MSNIAQTWTMIGATAAILGIVVGLQTFWISRALDRIEHRLDRIEDLLRDHDNRIAKLEAGRA